MKVLVERIGSFSFKPFVFAPDRVQDALLAFCLQRRTLRFSPAELETDTEGDIIHCNSLREICSVCFPFLRDFRV